MSMFSKFPPHSRFHNPLFQSARESLIDKLRELSSPTTTQHDLAKMLGVSQTCISRYQRAHGLPHPTKGQKKAIHMANQPARRDKYTYSIKLTEEAAKSLSPHASKRGIFVSELVRRIIDAALKDGIVDAVLDDVEPAK